MHEDLFERFMQHVIIRPDGCWQWTGQIGTGGYGYFSVSHDKLVRAHRFAYEMLVGPIPEGKHLDHLCHHRYCVNPADLEPVTPAENIARADMAPATINRGKTHCPKGHPYSGDNLLVRKGKRKGRECKACGREEAKRYLAANRDAINARRRARKAAIRSIQSGN